MLVEKPETSFVGSVILSIIPPANGVIAYIQIRQSRLPRHSKGTCVEVQRRPVLPDDLANPAEFRLAALARHVRAAAVATDTNAAAFLGTGLGRPGYILFVCRLTLFLLLLEKCCSGRLPLDVLLVLPPLVGSAEVLAVSDVHILADVAIETLAFWPKTFPLGRDFCNACQNWLALFFMIGTPLITSRQVDLSTATFAPPELFVFRYGVQR